MGSAKIKETMRTTYYTTEKELQVHIKKKTFTERRWKERIVVSLQVNLREKRRGLLRKKEKSIIKITKEGINETPGNLTR